MAPYVKRFFQIDGNSPKKTPSKSPQSSPSPEIPAFGKFDRVANDEVERRRMGRHLPPPQEGTTYFTGESSSKSSQPQPSSMKTPSRSVKKSPGKVSKRSLKSPEISKFGRHQFPRAGNDYSEKKRYESATRRPLPKPETNANDDEELLRWHSRSQHVPLKFSPPQAAPRGRRLFHTDDDENSTETTTPRSSLVTPSNLGRVQHSPQSIRSSRSHLASTAPLPTPSNLGRVQHSPQSLRSSRSHLASTAPMEPIERHVPLQHSPQSLRSSRSQASSARIEYTPRYVPLVHSPQEKIHPKSPFKKSR